MQNSFARLRYIPGKEYVLLWSLKNYLSYRIQNNTSEAFVKFWTLALDGTDENASQFWEIYIYWCTKYLICYGLVQSFKVYGLR